MKKPLLSFWIIPILAATALTASADYNLTDLQDALKAHQASWVNKDSALLVKTSHFPNTQFYPNGRTVVVHTAADGAQDKSSGLW